MINRIIITGRLTKAPDMKYTQSGIPVTRFTVAVNRAFKSQDGEQQADFINCVAWRKQAENVANFLNKGSLVGVDGRISTGSYEGQDGKRVFTVEVVAESVQFLEPKSNRSESPNSSQSGQYQQPNAPAGNYGQQTYTPPGNDPFSGGGPVEVVDDDLPF
ncbi:single-stranded DNA-binding protein [Bacillus sp. OxB-1]|uniref:single-stranded DNA-binding protein n=1 Tax=Bacillus sp. (strain OxB-1) TaxID=98228 RepID=UPI0005821535|nr:single-stranded DNA-binding protein [Bacillus sp. OxB-1]BAQ11333.1 single-stranded DNA-binding protein [Bacillus sp. OxB-1]